jgi:hypothetical protein
MGEAPRAFGRPAKGQILQMVLDVLALRDTFNIARHALIR